MCGCPSIPLGCSWCSLQAHCNSRRLPVCFCFIGAQSASVFALSAGAVSFRQIIKALELAFTAVLSQFLYGKKNSKTKWMCLPIVIGGVILASVKGLDFRCFSPHLRLHREHVPCYCQRKWNEKVNGHRWSLCVAIQELSSQHFVIRKKVKEEHWAER